MPTRSPEHHVIDQVQLARIQELFHGLIRSRAREGGLEVPADLPEILNLPVNADARWFPVPGMAGGFSYRLVIRGTHVALTTESWSRLAEGSGMRHRITPTQVILQDAGFV